MSARSMRIGVAIMAAVAAMNAASAAAASASEVAASVQTASAAAGSPARVLVSWSEDREAEGYNIYRKTGRLVPYPATPLNRVPIAMMTDCAAITAILGGRAEELRALSTIRLPREKESLRGAAGPGSISLREIDPCSALSRARGTEAWEQVQFYARRYYRIALVIGQAYVDSTAAPGTECWYELRALRGGRERTLVTDLRVTAGRPAPLPAPAAVRAVAGDSRVMVAWEPVENATGYDLYRRTVPGGSAVKVNDAPVVSMLTRDLDGNEIAPVFGLVDYRRFDDATGMPLAHEVDGAAVEGPANGAGYQYQVAAINSFDQPGERSAFTATAVPVDKTPPGLPADLSVEAVGQTLVVTWTRVEKDQYGRRELDGMRGYHVYRSESQSDMSPAQINPAIIPQPPGAIAQYVDADPAIRSQFGEKEFYYRIRCVDARGNASALSSAAGGHVPDITPPAIPVAVEAEGRGAGISVLWRPNDEPDIESYAIMRSLCHRGEWFPPEHAQKRGIDCGPFAMIAEISHAEAVDSARVRGKAVFTDRTVPNGSPLCYAYWVKARDRSQNLSGSWPYPSAAERAGIVCQRLRDEIPPPPPVVTAVRALDGRVGIEWISAPSQDLHAFHVYRSEEERDGFRWIGGIRIEEPPAPHASLSAPYAPAAPSGCGEIPLVPHDGMTAGSFIDKSADPRTVYWYRVAAVDKDGNESPLERSVPYSTFTFKKDGPPAPAIAAVRKTAASCGLDISWTPPYDASAHLGFVVFRSPTEEGVYRQISPIVAGSSYVDAAIAAGAAYWYKVQAFDADGRPSEISPPMMGRYD